MAKAKSEMNRSQAIREFYAANPTASAKEVVAGLAQKGMTVKEGLVLRGQRRHERKEASQEADREGGEGCNARTARRQTDSSSPIL